MIKNSFFQNYLKNQKLYQNKSKNILKAKVSDLN